MNRCRQGLAPEIPQEVEGTEKQKLTLSLPKEIIRRAKVQAARENKSLTRFAQEAIEQKLNQSSGYTAARRRHLKILKEGMDLGTRGDLAVERERLHERRQGLSGYSASIRSAARPMRERLHERRQGLSGYSASIRLTARPMRGRLHEQR